jgi:glycosyltransferase involved in cell wall biosynthesis
MPSNGIREVDKYEVILVAPNVSEQMGGEAIKALQIYLELARQGIRVHQVTHIRAKAELDRKFPEMSVTYLPDTRIEKLLYRGPLFEQMLNRVFLKAAMKHVAELLTWNPRAVVHLTSPVSPILRYPSLPSSNVVIGPINGNIHYPPGFRDRETRSYKVRRWLHGIMQTRNRILPDGKRQAAAILVAGGKRTYDSLRMGGCTQNQFVDSIDSGVQDRLAALPRIEHKGTNPRFYHNGRLVEHKGTDLILKALTLTKLPIELTIIGRGPELPGLHAMVTEMSLENRVTFIEWVANHDDLAEMLRLYRAFVFPSLAEANGIVVQEAMVQGMPLIACDWGGPSLLVTPETGFLIPPRNEQFVVEELAAKMDLLAADGPLAERMSIAARKRALGRHYIWSEIIREWRTVYARIAPR